MIYAKREAESGGELEQTDYFPYDDAEYNPNNIYNYFWINKPVLNMDLQYQKSLNYSQKPV